MCALARFQLGHLEVRRDVGLELEGERSREGARNLARGS